MDAPMAKGTPVRQVVPTIEGTVSDVKFNADDLSFEYLVTYPSLDEEDGTSERWFKASEIAAIAPQEGGAA